MGILGRRRSPKPLEANTDGLKLLQQQLAHPDPVLRMLAEEVSVGKNAAPGTLIPFPAVRPIKERRNPSVAPQRQTLENNPDPKRLRWDHEKRAFRLINPTYAGGHGKSALTGEHPTCGLCDRRADRPKRFQPGSTGPACRYCGRVGKGSVCIRCEAIRTGYDTAHMSRHSIADRRGWTGPPTIGDDELWITIIRRLRDADNRRLALDEKDARKAARARRRATGAKEEFEEAAE